MTSRRSCRARWAFSGPRGLLRRRVAVERQRPRVHAEQRQPVPEHVVHLPGQRLPRLVRGVLGPQRRGGLGHRGPFAQRLDQQPAAAHEQPPAEHRRVSRHQRPDQQPQRGLRRGPPGVVHRERRDAAQEHRGRDPGRAAGGDREQRDQPRDGRDLGERAQHDDAHGHRQRVPAPPPERDAGQHPRRDVDTQQHLGPLRRRHHPQPGHEQPDQGRHHDHQAVDDPPPVRRDIGHDAEARARTAADASVPRPGRAHPSDGPRPGRTLPRTDPDGRTATRDSTACTPCTDSSGRSPSSRPSSP